MGMHICVQVRLCLFHGGMCVFAGWCVLEILVDGFPSNRVQFCIGERVTFVCTADEVDVFLWTTIPPLDTTGPLIVQSANITAGVDVITTGEFTAKYLARGKSTFEVVVFDGLNVGSVTCSNFIGPVTLSSYSNITFGMFHKIAFNIML